jgi:Phytanoyl-CoA dioxygenase (PhyH)
VARDTLLITSIEGILSPTELSDVRARVDREVAGRREEFAVATRTRSVHGIDGATTERAKEVYEPNGRLEYDRLSSEVAELMEAAVLRRLPDIQRSYPSVRRSMDWFYVEYEAGQFITPHVDYSYNAMDPSRPKIAAISVLIKSSGKGGAFFVETSSDAGLWTADGDVRRGADGNSDWFRRMPRTRWRVLAKPGDAICWGTELTHGTEPVQSGVVGKLIAFLAA